MNSALVALDVAHAQRERESRVEHALYDEDAHRQVHDVFVVSGQLQHASVALHLEYIAFHLR
jgi:hypothetical protein